MPGVIDSSCGGLCSVAKNTIDYFSCVHEKIKRELTLQQHEVKIVGVGGVHSTNKPDLSGTVDFIVKTSVNKEDFIRRIRGTFEEFFIVPQKKLLHFMQEHAHKDLGWEGVATLFTALDVKDRKKLLSIVNSNTKVIKFGKLVDDIVVHSK